MEAICFLVLQWLSEGLGMSLALFALAGVSKEFCLELLPGGAFCERRFTKSEAQLKSVRKFLLGVGTTYEFKGNLGKEESVL